MKRRDFLRQSGAALTVATVGCVASTRNAQSKAAAKAPAIHLGRSKKPNILYFIPHDLGNTVACLGYPGVKTPNLDRLGAGGVRFTNHFCAATACSPARGTLMTGRYSHCNGLLGLVNRGFVLPTEERTIVDYLNAAGYHTCQNGYQHENKKGANNRRYQESADRTIEEARVELVCDSVVQWLKEKRPKDKPFYLNAGAFDCHFPWNREVYQGRVKPEDVRLPVYMPDTPEHRANYAQFLSCVSYMDECYGRILDALDETGLAENTIVIFTTDHGIQFPRAKSTLYDPGMRTAMLWRWPDHLKAGLECRHMTSSVDLVPSILEMLELPIPEAVQGRSYAPFLLGKDYQPHERIFLERNFHDDFDPMRAVRTERHKLIRNYSKRSLYLPGPMATERGLTDEKSYKKSGVQRPEFELYDLVADPNEFNNIAEEPAQATVLAGLKGQLAGWMCDTQDFMRSASGFPHMPAWDQRFIPEEKPGHYIPKTKS